MLTIYKYQIPLEDRFTKKFPDEYKILSVGVQNNTPFIWVLLDSLKDQNKTVNFRLAGTGHYFNELIMSQLNFIGSFELMKLGSFFIGHLFEIKNDNAILNLHNFESSINFVW